MNYYDLINELKTVRHCCRRLIEINQELEVLNHQLTGMARSGLNLTTEQQKSNLPMPSYQHEYRSPLGILETISEKKSDFKCYEKRIKNLSCIEMLPLEDQNLLFDRYVFRDRPEDVADRYGYSRNGLYKHIKSILKSLI